MLDTIARERAVENYIQRFCERVSADERTRLDEALSDATGLQRSLLAGDGSLAVATRKSILDAFALRMMQVEG